MQSKYLYFVSFQTGMASSNSNDYLPPLTKDDIQTFVNKRTCDKIIPHVFSLVLVWGSTKHSNETFEDYIKTRRNITDDSEWKKFLKRFNKGEQSKLKLMNAVTFDTTFFCKLLPLLCNNIEEMGSDAWKTKDESKIEYLLSTLKDSRNAVMHEPKGAAIQQGIQNEILRVSLKLIEVAGHVFGKSCIDDEKLKLQTIFDEIQISVLSDKEKRLWKVRRKLLDDGLLAMRQFHLKFEQKIAPEFSCIHKFYPLKLTSTIQGDVKIKFSCTDLFERIILHYSSINVFIIEGGGGSGKSTMITQMESQILGCGNSKTFEKIEAFDVCLRVNCRDSTYETVANFIQDSFCLPKSGGHLSTFSDCGIKLSGDDMKDALRLMNLMLLIDGVDELNDNSSRFVQKIIKYSKIHPEAKCIVTSRPHSSVVFTDILDKEGIPYQIIKVEELRSRVDQKEFLKSSCINGDEVAAAFTALDLDLSYPVHLALFSYFYSSDSTSVKSWTSSIEMMKHTLNHNSTNAVRRLQQKSIQNADMIVKEILATICCVSYISLYLGDLHLERKFYDAVRESSFKFFRLNIDYHEILSCFLKPSKSHGEPSYQFYHKSHQELMAGTFLGKKIVEDGVTPSSTWDSTLQQVFEKALKDMVKYKVIVRKIAEPSVTLKE